MYFPKDIQVIFLIIAKLRLDPKVEEKTVELSCIVFNAQYDQGYSVTNYQVHNKKLKVIQHVTGRVGPGYFFHLAARQIACVRKKLLLGFLNTCYYV